MDILDTDMDTMDARSVRLTPPFLLLLMPHPLLSPILAMVLVLATLMEHPSFTELFPILTLLPTKTLLSLPAKLTLKSLLLHSPMLIMSGILMLTAIWVIMDSPFLLLTLPKNPQLLKPERNVRLRLKLIPKLGIMATTDMDMVDTMD